MIIRMLIVIAFMTICGDAFAADITGEYVKKGTPANGDVALEVKSLGNSQYSLDFSMFASAEVEGWGTDAGRYGSCYEGKGKLVGNQIKVKPDNSSSITFDFSSNGVKVKTAGDVPWETCGRVDMGSVSVDLFLKKVK